jgi:hypothetical protein
MSYASIDAEAGDTHFEKNAHLIRHEFIWTKSLFDSTTKKAKDSKKKVWVDVKFHINLVQRIS